MKAAVYDQVGAPDVFRYADVPDPVVHPSGVIVEVGAVGIQGGDVLHGGGPPPPGGLTGMAMLRYLICELRCWHE